MKRLDSQALYAALDVQRKSGGLSWCEAADQMDVSTATISRTREGGRMEVDGMLAMIAWLDVPVERFVRDSPQ